MDSMKNGSDKVIALQRQVSLTEAAHQAAKQQLQDELNKAHKDLQQ